MNNSFLEKVGFSFYEVTDFDRKNIILRDGREAFIWVHKMTGHGILDERYWENIEDDYYEDDYRNEFNASIDEDVVSPSEHLDTYKNLNMKQFKQFSNHLSDKTKYLEVGCSFGGMLKNVVGAGVKSCSVVEPNKTDVKFLRDNFKDVNIFNSIFEKIDTEEKYNLVTSFEVLEHIVSPNIFVKRCYDLMESGGIINIEVPNHKDVLLFYDSPRYKNFYYHKAHIHYFTDKSLSELFKINGFDGKVSSFLMYPFFNHVFWYQNDKPQGYADIALTTPIPTGGSSIAENEINNFYKDIENQYEKLINKHMLGDCLVFQGVKNG